MKVIESTKIEGLSGDVRRDQPARVSYKGHVIAISDQDEPYTEAWLRGTLTRFERGPDELRRALRAMASRHRRTAFRLRGKADEASRLAFALDMEVDRV